MFKSLHTFYYASREAIVCARPDCHRVKRSEGWHSCAGTTASPLPTPQVFYLKLSNNFGKRSFIWLFITWRLLKSMTAGTFRPLPYLPFFHFCTTFSCCYGVAKTLETLSDVHHEEQCCWLRLCALQIRLSPSLNIQSLWTQMFALDGSEQKADSGRSKTNDEIIRR